MKLCATEPWIEKLTMEDGGLLLGAHRDALHQTKESTHYGDLGTLETAECTNEASNCCCCRSNKA